MFSTCVRPLIWSLLNSSRVSTFAFGNAVRPASISFVAAADGSPALAVLAVAFVAVVVAVVAVESEAGVCCDEHAANASALSARAVRCASMSSWVKVAPERRD